MLGHFIIAALMLAYAGAAAAAEQQPICPDRPSKSTGTCTVPMGSWQVETGLVDWTHDKSARVRTDFTTYGSSLIKYGVSERVDVELGITPLETMEVHGGLGEHHSSFGDTLLRAKVRLTSSEAPVQVAFDPYVKLPTASRKVGDGKLEGGFVVPVSIPIGKSPFTLSLDPELDVLADANGNGRHFATQQVVNLGMAASEKLSLSAEIWAGRNWDPAGTIRQASADGSVAYMVSKDLQIDAGANFGLNRQTADLEVYSGISVRF